MQKLTMGELTLTLESDLGCQILHCPRVAIATAVLPAASCICAGMLSIGANLTTTGAEDVILI